VEVLNKFCLSMNKKCVSRLHRNVHLLPLMTRVIVPPLSVELFPNRGSWSLKTAKTLTCLKEAEAMLI